jgi:hypothetical protein
VDELGNRVLIVAFDGWNDAGEAASAAAAHIRESGAYREVFAVDPELYFDYQYTRPQITLDADGSRTLTWPDATLWRPLHPADGTRLWVLSGSSPRAPGSRSPPSSWTPRSRRTSPASSRSAR